MKEGEEASAFVGHVRVVSLSPHDSLQYDHSIPRTVDPRWSGSGSRAAELDCQFTGAEKGARRVRQWKRKIQGE